MDEKGIGANYAENFLEFIHGIIELPHLASKDVLEVGCGTGYLLNRLKEHGANVMGYEPGYEALGKYPINVIKGFFPTDEIKGKKFDVIIAYGLLEHVEDPGDFLTIIGDYLKDSGHLIVSVPDCEDHIRVGDLSMLIHEHFSYFTCLTLQSLVERSGFKKTVVKKSSFGGSIYSALKKNEKSEQSDVSPLNVSADFSEILGRINSNLARVEKFLRANANKSLGVYIPLRAINTLFLFKDLIQDLNISLRFFDDSPYLKGKYFPGFEIPIENKENLLAEPCDVVLIYSYTFAQKILDGLHGKLPQTCDIFRFQDIEKDFTDN